MSVIDARGMRCPWPAIRAARALRDLAPGTEITVLADDPAAARELEQLAAGSEAAFEQPDPGKFRIRKLAA
jgi:tRNA 2-thiouridine synthesizing protein A